MAFISSTSNFLLAVLEFLGINPLEHDIRFVEDNSGKPVNFGWSGWEVRLDGKEITQSTYPAVGGLTTQPVTAEVTYGLERLASYIKKWTQSTY